MRTFTFLMIAVSFIVSTTAFAERGGQTYQLDYGDQIYRGDSTLFLKRELARQHRIDLRDLEDADLVSVTLVAKTEFGQGTAALAIDGYAGAERRVYGDRRDFYSRDRRTFDEVTFYSDARMERGAWQIKLHGNFNVREVIVEMRRRYQPPRGELVVLKCESENYRYNTCEVNGRIARARLVRQYSNSACEQGRSWGVERNYVWVDRGCRGDFEVLIGDGRRGLDRRDGFDLIDLIDDVIR